MKDLKLPIRTQNIQLNGDYSGFEFVCRVNPPWGIFMNQVIDLEEYATNNPRDPKGTLDRLYGVLESVATSWNFVDEKGKAIPFNREGFQKVPIDLIQSVIRQAREVIEGVPLASSAE